MSWKPAMLCSKVWSYNALRFAERWEALASASDLYSRWTVPEAYEAHESDDPVNYHWDRDARRAVEGPMPDSVYEARARAVCEALAITSSHWMAWLAEWYQETHVEPPFVVPWSREMRVDSLPLCVRTGLQRIGYGLRTVAVVVAHRKIVVSAVANDGQRASVVTCEPSSPLVDGAMRVTVETGPYGGPNMFGACSIERNPIRVIPEGGAIITSSTTHKRRAPYATIHALAIDALAWIAPESPDLAVARDAREEGRYSDARDIARRALDELAAPSMSAVDEAILDVYASYKSHARPRYLADAFAGDAVAMQAAIDSLVARGMLKRTKTGATSITSEGRNAIRCAS